MKKNIKLFLSLSPLIAVLSTPLVVASCSNKNGDSTAEINQIISKKDQIQKIIKYEEDLNEKENAQKILEEINKLKKDEKDEKKVKSLLEKIKLAISSFNKRNTQEKSGLIVQKIAENQEEVIASDVVKELKSAKKWEDVKKVFSKYSIIFIENELREKEELSISASTHSHDDEGEIHLDIKFKVLNTTIRFTLIGFKKIEPVKMISNWKFTTKLKNKIEEKEAQTNFLNKLKAEQEKGFKNLLEELQKTLPIEKIDKNKNDIEFSINFDDSKTKFVDNFLILNINFYNTADKKIVQTESIQIENIDDHHEE
ncbi:Vmc-like lipoprotein signal peptide domain-containing protein [Mycoplasma sp. 327]